MKTLDKELFSKNLIFLREKNGLTQTQLANVLGTSQVNISNWEKGLKAPKDFRTLKKISDYFQVSVDSLLFENLFYSFNNIDPNLDTIIELNDSTKFWLTNLALSKTNVDDSEILTSKNNTGLSTDKVQKLTVYGKVCAGDGIEAFEDPIDEILNPYPNSRGEIFALQVHGDSMNNIVNDGMYAIIKKQDIVNNGEIAVILINQQIGMLKRFYQIDDMLVLRPDSSNPQHIPLTFIGEQLNDIKVIGKFIGHVSPMLD
ncbi:helix-turn-helix domain-containing protein [Turicibacter sanguinis]|uniref:helix-turn-helix domain-containing protein n=1 Tax=Turicibacter sanguinis TaxID=154288 RepID=UPI0012BD334B|nr:XRE family transcriptional regulator [Turicibacter sanguinis]MCU7196531.1 XRE family transcriptional regulator [Turicibacter sanguinis]MTN80738.1 helix-turn-helix domain-containing protein [Turicibacter sanguinis]MTN82687.1 helix-turn-helix domain-containing protein [Turicibacter sanguinis]MTN85635.1 helix-turn-helix domain-containing protein [Turicibacter sanguinis]MTN88417.1 helix-turn-helix domain-containing protein [Turicibacter sanguinis]